MKGSVVRIGAWLVGANFIVSSAAVIAPGLASRSAVAEEREAEVWSARGIIKAIDAARGTVTIAHEAIPGFMGAMTMSFEAASAEQLRGLAIDDRVRFSFTAKGRVLRSIVKDG